MSRRAWVLFGALSVIWGVPYLLIRISVRQVNPATLVFLRTAPVAVILLPMVVQRKQLRELLRRWRPLLAYTAAELLVAWLALFKAEQRISSSLAGLLLAAVPLVGVVLARLAGDEDRLGPRQLGGLALGFAGVATLVGVDVSGATAWPVALMLVPIFGYAIAPRIFDKYLSDIPSLSVVTGSMVITAVLYAPFALSHLPAHMSVEVTASVVGLALGPTLVGFLVFFALIGEVGPVRATIVSYVNPAVAVVAGVVVLSEPLTVGLAVGLPLVLAGSILSAHRRPEQEAPATRPSDSIPTDH